MTKQKTIKVGNYSLTPDQFSGAEKFPGSLDLSGLTSIPAGFNPTVGSSLDLSGLTSIPAGFNPTVGGSLYLGGLTSIPAGFNPTVGGYLYLSGLTSIPAGFNPTVGGSLDLGGLTKPPKKLKKRVPVYPLTWLDGKYLLVDGIVSEVVQKRGDVYRVKVVGKKVVSSLVTDGRNWSHGATLQEARADLVYKNKGADMSAYKKLTLASKLTFAEGIACYRAITGACSFGVRNFVESKGVKARSVTVAQIIKMTEGQYRADVFAVFFAGAKAAKGK